MSVTVNRSLVEDRVIDALLNERHDWKRFAGENYVLYTADAHPQIPGHTVHLMVHIARNDYRYELSVYHGSAYSRNLVLASGSSRLETLARTIDPEMTKKHDDAALYTLLTAIKQKK